VLRSYTNHYNAKRPHPRTRSFRPMGETQPLDRPAQRSNATICLAASFTNTEQRHEPSF
jgi:hypothetical protein